MAANSSQFVFSWLGCGVGGLVEVPVNTAYEGEFLRHQVGLVQARWAVIDDVHAPRFVALRDDLPSLEGFWVIDTGQLAPALDTLRSAAGRPRPGTTCSGPPPAGNCPTRPPQSLASVFFTSGTTGPSKGVAMPHAQMYFFGSMSRRR